MSSLSPEDQAKNILITFLNESPRDEQEFMDALIAQDFRDDVDSPLKLVVNYFFSNNPQKQELAKYMVNYLREAGLTEEDFSWYLNNSQKKKFVELFEGKIEQKKAPTLGVFSELFTLDKLYLLTDKEKRAHLNLADFKTKNFLTWMTELRKISREDIKSELSHMSPNDMREVAKFLWQLYTTYYKTEGWQGYDNTILFSQDTGQRIQSFRNEAGLEQNYYNFFEIFPDKSYLTKLLRQTKDFQKYPVAELLDPHMEDKTFDKKFAQHCHDSTKTDLSLTEEFNESFEGEIVGFLQNGFLYCISLDDLVRTFQREEMKNDEEGSGVINVYKWDPTAGSYGKPIESEPVYKLPLSFHLYVDKNVHDLILNQGFKYISLENCSDIPIGSVHGISRLHGAVEKVCSGRPISRVDMGKILKSLGKN